MWPEHHKGTERPSQEVKLNYSSKMTFVVYATYSVAIAIFVFWFGVWMLHLIAIAYG